LEYLKLGIYASGAVGVVNIFGLKVFVISKYKE
jgi:hypothetical protein